jgi:hypothetical protein
MAGMFEEAFPEKEKKRPGMPASLSAQCDEFIAGIFFIVGCRWRGLPKGAQWVQLIAG